MKLIAGQTAALGCATIILSILLAYSETFSCPLIFDDIPAIAMNLSLRRWEQVWPVFWDMPNSGEPVQGRPVLNASFAVNYAIGNLDVRGYHALNIGIHILGALVLFGLVRLTLRLPGISEALSARATGVALLAALVWGLHPLQTESVTYVSQRAESLAGLWYLLTLCSFARGATGSGPSARLWYLGAVAFCFLGVCTKEVVVSAPLAVLLYDRAFVAGSFRAALRCRPRFYAALFASWVPLLVLVTESGGRGGSAGFGTGITAFEYARSQSVYILKYLRLTIWPDPLVFDYGYELVTSPSEYIPAALVVAALAAAAIWAMIRFPRLGLLAFLFFALLAPTSSIIPVATQTMAEHRMYLPLAPLLTLAVVASVAGAGQLGRFRGVAPVAVVIGIWMVLTPLLGFATFMRNRDYATERGMWADVLAKRPNSVRAILFFADHDDDPVAAESRYRQAIGLTPDGRTWESLILFFHRRGRTEQALAVCDEMMNANKFGYGRNGGYGYLTRSKLRFYVGDTEGALQDVDAALAQGLVGNNLHVVHMLRGAIYCRFSNWVAARAEFNKAIECDPTAPDGYAHRGRLRGDLGDRFGAVADFTEAMRLEPEETEHLASRAQYYFQIGKFDQSSADLDIAIRMKPKPEYLYHRGEVRRQQGRLDEAVADLDKAIAKRQDMKDAYLCRALCNLARQMQDAARTDLLKYQELGGRFEGDLKPLQELIQAPGNS